MRNLVTLLKEHRDLIVRFASEAIGKAAALILALLLARTLGTTGYAAIGNANLIAAALLPLLSFGLGFTLVRITAGLTRGQPVAERYYSSIALASVSAITFACIFWFLSPHITAALFDGPEWMSFVQFTAIYCVVSVLELLTIETLRARQQIVSASLLQITSSLGSLFICLLLFWQDALSPQSALIVLIGLRVAMSFASHVLLIVSGQITLKPVFCSLSDTKSAFLSGLPFAVSGFGTWLIEHGDRFVLTTMMEQDDFGRYLGALVILSVIGVFGAPFWYLLFPKLAQNHATKDIDKFTQEGRKSLTLFLVVIAPVTIFVTIALPDLLPALAGLDYQIDIFTSCILVLSLLAIQAGSPWEYACIVEGHSKSYLLRTLTFGVIGLILGILFIPYLGITGAALSALLARVGLGLSLYQLASSSGHGRTLLPKGKTILAVIIASIPTMICCIFILRMDFLEQAGVWRSLLVYALAFIPVGLIYFLGLKLCKPFISLIKSS